MSASPAAVRSFARAAGMTVGDRGKFSPEVIAAFNKGKPDSRKYVVGAYVPTVDVKVKGQRRPVKVNLDDARQVLRAAGVPVGDRGKIADAALLAVATGTVKEYAENLPPVTESPRDILRAAGMDVPKRGRLSNAALAAVANGTVKEFVASIPAAQ